MSSAWQELAKNIADNTLQVTLFQTLSTKINGFTVNMDCLKIALAPGAWGDLVGVFHVGSGIGPNGGPNSQLYVATAHLNNLKDWTVTKGPYSEAGSQGHIQIDPATQAAFLAYELEMDGGNTVAIRRYKDIATLVASGGFDEFQLSQTIHTAADPNTWQFWSSSVTNVGTPTVESLAGGDLKIRCHYSPEGTHDLPAYGIVSLGSSGGISENWGSWVGVFDNWVNNSLKVLGAQGKIGGRDFIIWEGSPTYIYEAQLVQDDWHTWRPFLLVPDRQEAYPIDLNVQGTTDFANPHMTFVPPNLLLQTYFVPSERNGTLSPGTLLRVSRFPAKRPGPNWKDLDD